MSMDIDSRPVRRAVIDCDALVANVLALGVSEVDVSANAFGHGADIVLTALSSLSEISYTVGRTSEAESLANRWPLARIRVTESDPVQTALVYGLQVSNDAKVTPVMTLEAQVLAVKTIEMGGGVSYGYTWKAPHDGHLALVALGYADGFNRAWGNRVHAQTSLGKSPAVGRVAMDAHSIWTDTNTLNVGDMVAYFGHTVQGVVFAQDFAEAVGASPLSVTANLGTRIQRVVHS